MDSPIEFSQFTSWKSPRISPGAPAPPAPGHVSNHLHDQQHGGNGQHKASVKKIRRYPSPSHDEIFGIFQPKYGRFIALMWLKQCHFYHPWLGMVFITYKNGWWLGDGLVWFIIVLPCFTHITNTATGFSKKYIYIYSSFHSAEVSKSFCWN